MDKNKRTDLRNVAIIAHVDHGKTTLVDSMLKQTGEFKVRPEENQDCVLDSNSLERERGITILSKNTSVPFKGITINIVDTPGHADFGSEVERVLRLVEGVLLVVDAVEGPMPQTRFVLRKSLEMGLKPIVVINKMDRPGADPHKALNHTFDLFVALKASDYQLEFPYIFASGREGWSSRHEERQSGDRDLTSLFDLIVHTVPPPCSHPDKPMRMLVTMLEWNNFVGQVSVGRVFEGSLLMNQPIQLLRGRDPVKNGRVTFLQKFTGLSRSPASGIQSGDICVVGGLDGVQVGDTIAAPEAKAPLDPIVIEAPTMSVGISVNDSAFSGREGELMTTRHLRERLFKEVQTNAGLTVEEKPDSGTFKVSGRGELHLTILIETMRREGYEMSVSKPEVITHQEQGRVVEPAEYLIVDIEERFQGVVMESLGRRGAQMKDLAREVDPSGVPRVRIDYVIPARSLMGFKQEYLIKTRGTGIMHQSFHGFVPHIGEVNLRTNGVLIAKEAGEATAYALASLEERSTLFVGPGESVYEGMIVGENAREKDMVVNPCKQKNLTNMRAAGSDETVQLTPARRFTLEQAIEFIDRDELVEVTPKSLRLRKKFLSDLDRRRALR